MTKSTSRDSASEVPGGNVSQESEAKAEPVTSDGSSSTLGRYEPNWVVWNGRLLVSVYSAVCLVHNIKPGRDFVAKLRKAKDARHKNFEGHLLTLQQWLKHDSTLRADPDSTANVGARTDMYLHRYIEFVRDKNPFPDLKLPKAFLALHPPLSTQRAQVETHHNEATGISTVSTTAEATNPSEAQVAIKKTNPPQKPINLDEPGLLRIDQVLMLIPVSRSTWYAGIKSGKFPKPIGIHGTAAVGWDKRDIKSLLESWKT